MIKKDKFLKKTSSCLTLKAHIRGELWISNSSNKKKKNLSRTLM